MNWKKNIKINYHNHACSRRVYAKDAPLKCL